MTTKVTKQGNVTTTVVDMTNGVGGRTAEVAYATMLAEISAKI